MSRQLLQVKPGSGINVVIQSMKHESIHGHTEWLAHINFLGQLYHPNLVKLVGYCIEDKLRLLIHEFTPRGSLENHIFMRGSFFQPLSWNLRLKVALGAAKGLAFLQSPEVSIVHDNFSTSCILLDLNYNAKLSGFGLGRDEPADEDSRLITNQVYPAREDIITGNVTPKGNVYSFGVVLLEMLSGRRAIDGNRVCNEIRLLEWAPPCLANRRKVSRVLDNRLDGQYTIDAAYNVATLVLRCISKEAKLRPTMEQVVKQLEELQEPIATSPAQTRLI